MEVQTPPLPQGADVDTHDMLVSTSIGMVPQPQDSVSLAWSEFL